MNKYLIFVLSATIFCSCENITGSGHIETEMRNPGRFEGVQASGSMDIEVTTGDQLSVKVESDDNVLPYIVTEVNNGLLDIRYKPNTSFNNVHAKVYVTAPALNKLFVKGSGNIVSKNTVKHSESIAAEITGSGDINADVDAPDIEAKISGSGNLNLHGRCKNFVGNISGSGDLKCANLLSEKATISIYGSGTAHVFSSEHLKATTAGSGDIYYGGNPSTEISKTGSGSVEHENK